MQSELVDRIGTRQPSSRSRSAPRWLLRRIAGSDAGRLEIETPSGATWVHQGDRPGPDARLVVHRWSALRRLVTGGDIGFAEAYRLGEWETPDLVAFFAWVTANEAALALAWRGTAASRFFDRLRHTRRANTRSGSRRNIAAHYDLGNDFYGAWLDNGMNYSSALYVHGDETLEAAQSAKLDRIMGYLDLPDGGRVLEIGCGWGALAERIAATPGCHVDGVTLSVEQFRYARRRLDLSGHGGNAELQLTDYRDVRGTYDGIASIEMLEAVGEDYWSVYFAKLNELLRPGGRAVLQVITINEDRFDSYRARPDFIQRYIFPGGMLLTKSGIATHCDAAGLRLSAVECFGTSYAKTLATWRSRFHAAWPQLSVIGYDDRLRRVWDYYLAYCEAGFRLGALDVGFYVVERRPST